MSVNKDVSVRQETEFAKFIGGNVVAGSGCGAFNCGDVEVSEWLIECKTVTSPQASFSVKKQWMDKLAEQSFESGKSMSALAFRFDPEAEDFIVMDRNTFKTLLSAYINQLDA